MSVPPRVDDFDMALCELIRRYKQRITQVKAMRQAQKVYFKLRGQKKHTEAKESLQYCKDLEKAVDKALEE